MSEDLSKGGAEERSVVAWPKAQARAGQIERGSVQHWRAVRKKEHEVGFKAC